MPSKLWSRLGCFLAACLAGSVAWGFDILRKDDGSLVTYDSGPIPMQIMLGTETTLEDGTNYSTSVQAAMTDWNPEIGAVQFEGAIVAPAPAGDGNHVNEIVFSDTIFGEAFGANTLAVTMSWVTVSPRVDGTYRRTQSDILFNTAKTWNSYRGAHRYGGPYDIRRVAIHELGHVLGLDHPDESVPPQSVTAIMNSTISNVDAIQPDDRAGAQFLYGSGVGQTTRPANDDFAAAFAVNLVNNAFSWSANNYGATKEPGEPNHATDEPGGSSVWWKWTAPGPGSMTITTAGSSFDTLLAAYTGSAVSALTQIASNDDVQSTVIRTSSITFATTTGTTYYIAVDGWDAWTGIVTLNLNYTPEVVNSAPVITSHPSSQGISAGQGAQFTVTAVGTPTPTYRWQRLPAGTGTWSDLYDGGNYSGTGLFNLTVNSATLVMSGDQFRCVASNAVGNATSNSATLTVNPVGPTITSHPQSRSINLGASVTFTASAIGIPAPTLQWQKDGVNIIGATGASYSIASVTPTDAGSYRVIATNTVGSAISNAALLTVLIPPVITTQPVSQMIVEGNEVTFMVVASGSPAPTYQWQKNGAVISGATSASFSISNVSASDAGTYRVIVTNTAGTATSAEAALYVTPRGPVITSLSPPRQVRAPGQSLALSVSAIGAGQITYQWIHDGYHVAGATGSTLDFSSLAPADSGWYCVDLTDANGTRRSAPIFVTVMPLVTEVRLWGTTSYNLSVPSDLSDAIAIEGGSTRAYAIKRDGTAISWGDNSVGATVELPGTSNIVAISSYGDRTLALKSDGSVAGITTYARPPAGLADVVGIAVGNDNSFALKSDGTVSRWSDRYNLYATGLEGIVAISARSASLLALKNDGTVVLWQGGSVREVPSYVQNIKAISVGPNHSLALRIDGTVVVWGYDPQQLNLLVPPDGLSGVVAIDVGNRHSLALKADGTVASWGYNDNGRSTPPQDLGHCLVISAGGSYSLALRDSTNDTVPTIVTQPVSQTVNIEDTITFDVGAISALQLTYQWRKNGQLISGANGSSLTLSNLTEGASGSYDVIVANRLGSVTSNAAVLLVNPRPVVTRLSAARQVLVPGSTLNLAVSATGSGSLHYQWYRNGCPLPNANASNLSILSSSIADNGWYYVDVTDDLGSRRSAVMFVTVMPARTNVRTWAHSTYYPSENLLTPSSLTDAIMIEGGSYFSVALRRDGTVIGWGDNFHGQITVPPDLTDVVALSAGSVNTFALKSDGTVVGWGNDARVPSGLNGVVAISQQDAYDVVALKSDGTVFRWARGDPLPTPPNLRDVVAVAAGGDFGMALKRDGTVVAWGDNTHGQCDVPAGLTGVKAIAAGTIHALALLENGTVVAWGYPTVTAVPAGLTNVVGIAAADTHSLALLADGTVKGWGEYIEPLPAVESVISISSGSRLSLALRDTASDTTPVITIQPQDTVGTETHSASLTVNATGPGPITYQWRKNGVDIAGATNQTLGFSRLRYGDAGNYDVKVINYLGQRISDVVTLTVIPVPIITGISASRQVLAIGQSLHLSVTAVGSGTLTYEWFKNGRLILGETGSTLSRSSVHHTDTGTYIVHITDSVGTRISPPIFVIVAPANTQVVGWGSNMSGEIAIPENLNDAIDIEASSGYALALKKDGTVVGWGDGFYGRLNIPSGLSGVVAIAAGSSHALALKSDGTVVAWGYNNYQQASVPPGLDSVVDIAAGSSFSLALKNDGTMVGWGNSQDGTTVAPDSRTDYTAIDASPSHVVALRADGSVVAWGNHQNMALQVPAGLSQVMKVASGGWHALALKHDGTLVGWGSNGAGQISTPGDLGAINDVSAGSSHSLALKSNGSVAAWGSNNYGETSVPAGLTGVYKLSAGAGFSLVLRDTEPMAPPVFLASPSSISIWMGDVAYFAAAVSGIPTPIHQWQIFNQGSGLWQDIADNQYYEGTATSRLTITGATPGNSGEQYRCIATNIHGSAISETATLTVGIPLPMIVSQPQSQAVLIGLQASLEISTTSPVPVTYQWQKDGTDIPGATSQAFLIPTFQIGDAGTYRVVVTNSGGSVTSNAATLAVAVVPIITTQPISQTVIAGSFPGFTVVASSNAPANYQWRKNGVDIYGATTPALNLTNVQAWDAAVYTVVVSNVAGQVVSAPAVLIVQLPPVVTQQPVSFTKLPGSTATFTVTAESSTLLSYQWQRLSPGSTTWASVLGANYVGGSSAMLTVDSLMLSNNGDQFRCLIGNIAGSVYSDTATLSVALPGSVKFSAGRYHSLRLDQISQLFVTGTNTYGQLGDGTTTNFTTPKQLTLPGQTVTDVAAGAEHSLFLTSSGQVWAAGFNATGQLGDGTNAAKSIPALLATNAAGIAAGRFHSVVLKADGTLWTTGGNDSGQLGNGTTTDTTALAQVATDVVELAAGIRQTFFIKSDGTLWGMGDMNGSGTPVSTPMQIASNVKSVAAGGYHSLFLKTDGTLWALGYNPFGQLGTTDTTDRLTPVQVATGVKAIATGYFHSAFIKTNDSLWLMGYNSSGQLGDGTTTNRPAPFQLDTNVAAVSASEAYTLYTRTNGSLWGTGYNAYGQFGNGGTVVTTSPVQIATGVILAPEAPAGLAAAPSVSFDRVRLLWTPQGSAATYEVWRHSANNSANATLLASGLRWPVFEDRTVALGQAYYYWIKAVNSAGSTFSAPASASTGASLSQTITFTGPLDQPYTAAPITLIATASSGLPVSFSLVSGPATLTGDQLTLTGVGTVTVRASQAGDAGYDPAPDVDRVFTVSENFDSWGLAHFTGDELNNAAISGPNADPDGDGYANLVEYALGLGPKTASTTGLPEATADATHWIYTYTRPEGRTDVTCTVEVSVDLSGWGAPTVAGVLVSANAGVETWQAKQLLTSANTFFRLKVSQ